MKTVGRNLALEQVRQSLSNSTCLMGAADCVEADGDRTGRFVHELIVRAKEEMGCKWKWRGDWELGMGMVDNRCGEPLR